MLFTLYWASADISLLPRIHNEWALWVLFWENIITHDIGRHLSTQVSSFVLEYELSRYSVPLVLFRIGFKDMKIMIRRSYLSEPIIVTREFEKVYEYTTQKDKWKSRLNRGAVFWIFLFLNRVVDG